MPLHNRISDYCSVGLIQDANWGQAGPSRQETSPSAGLTLGQRLRRWPNIKTALCERMVSDGVDVYLPDGALGLGGLADPPGPSRGGGRGRHGAAFFAHPNTEEGLRVMIKSARLYPVKSSC